MLQMEASCEETKRRFIQLQEEDGKLQQKITSTEAKAEQHKEKHRQRESELEKVCYNRRALDLGLLKEREYALNKAGTIKLLIFFVDA